MLNIFSEILAGCFLRQLINMEGANRRDHPNPSGSLI